MKKKKKNYKRQGCIELLLKRSCRYLKEIVNQKETEKISLFLVPISQNNIHLFRDNKINVMLR